MIAILCIILLPLLVFLYNILRMENDFLESLRNALIMMCLCVVMSLPVGKWETREFEATGRSVAAGLYVTPCVHHLEDGCTSGHVTPPYTSYLNLIFSDESSYVVYCDDCHTREEAIAMYIAQR